MSAVQNIPEETDRKGKKIYMKRLCIYLTYDKQKIVDKYIGYMLKELKTCVDHLAVVCNEPYVALGTDILEEFADAIFYRENIGFDVGGFKDALCNFLGWDKVMQYDELVLVNDSMFGPFRSMKVIFDEMENREVDFWGLSKHGRGRHGDIGSFPEHIQSFFIVVGGQMLHCWQFREYWEKQPYFSSFSDVIERHEMKFTEYFSGLGYRFATLADTEANDSLRIENNYTQYGIISFEMIQKRNFPFLKKKSLTFDSLNLQTQENLHQALSYINNETDYDIGLIWDNIIRTLNVADLQRMLHFQYILSAEEKGAIDKNIMILLFVSYKESAEYVLEYIQELLKDCSVKIYSERKECLEAYQNKGLECCVFRSEEMMELLSGFCGYDFVCILHDVDMTSDIKPSCIGKSYFYNIWENLIKSKNYISRILKLFEKETWLGFLAPPQPNFAEYFGIYGKGWSGAFDTLNRITEDAGIRCQLSEQIPPFRITDNFWIRGKILKKLKNLKAEDAKYLSYLWTYLAQDAGYYSGIVESEEYASMNEVNLQHYLQQIAFQFRREYGDFETFSEMRKMLMRKALEAFLGKHSRIFVYGIGKMMEQCQGLLPDIEAYIVSVGQAKPEEIDGIPVKYLHEVDISGNCGIVLCLNPQNQEQVIPMLKQYGFHHYFCV